MELHETLSPLMMYAAGILFLFISWALCSSFVNHIGDFTAADFRDVAWIATLVLTSQAALVSYMAGKTTYENNIDTCKNAVDADYSICIVSDGETEDVTADLEQMILKAGMLQYRLKIDYENKDILLY